MENEGIEPHEELDELLNGEPEQDLNAVQQEETGTEPEEEKGEEEQEEVEAQAEDEPEKEEVPPTSNVEKENTGQLAALQAERSKRQLAEMELNVMRQQIAQMQANQPQEGNGTIDPFSDPDQFTSALRNSVADTVRQTLTAERVETSEAAMIERLGPEKYEEVITEFQILANNDPSIFNAARTSRDPGKYVEQIVERHRKLAAIGNDPSAYEERIRQEERAKVEAEIAAKYADQASRSEMQSKANALPRTIANSGGGAPSVNEMPSDDLASLLGEV